MHFANDRSHRSCNGKRAAAVQNSRKSSSVAYTGFRNRVERYIYIFGRKSLHWAKNSSISWVILALTYSLWPYNLPRKNSQRFWAYPTRPVPVRVEIRPRASRGYANIRLNAFLFSCRSGWNASMISCLTYLSKLNYTLRRTSDILCHYPPGLPCPVAFCQGSNMN